MRVFVAIELSREIKRSLADAVNALAEFEKDIRLVRDRNMHLTTKFLGEVPDSDIAAVCDVCTQAAGETSPFEFGLDDCGCFPHQGRVRVVWCGPSADIPEMTDLVNRCDERLANLGFSRELRPFSPHITIGRVREDRTRGRLRQTVEQIRIRPAHQSVNQLTVFQSTLSPQGPRYAPLSRCPFQGNAWRPYKLIDGGLIIMEPETQATRKLALDRTLQQIEKSFGKGAVMQLDNMTFNVEGISSGALSLDLALGGKGFPRGRIVELYGPESSGKTTLALHTIASAQANDGVCAFIDAEHALDASWAKRCGVKLDSLLVSQPSSGEEALEITEMLVRSNAVDVIVVDSVAALIPKAEIEGEMGAQHVAGQARLMSQAMRKLTGAISKSGTVLIFINQIRMKIGVMFGNPETTPGGRALKFYASVRVDIRRISTIKEGEISVGNQVRAKVVKNKVAPPFRNAEFDIMFDSGISREGDLIELALKDNIVRKSGAWFSYGDVRIGQGRENAKQFLRDNPDLCHEMHDKVLAAHDSQNEVAAEKPDIKAAKTDRDTVQKSDTTAKSKASPAAAPLKRKRA